MVNVMKDQFESAITATEQELNNLTVIVDSMVSE